MRTLQCTVPAAFDGRPLKHLLRGELGISSTLLKTLKWREGAILLNGAGVHVNAVVRTGDTVTVVLSERAPRETDVAPLDIPLAIVYEDEDLLVLNKPAGLAMHPMSTDLAAPNLAGALVAYLGEGTVPHFVSRLDKGTSGLLIAAKSGYVHELLRRALHDRLVEVFGIEPGAVYIKRVLNWRIVDEIGIFLLDARTDGVEAIVHLHRAGDDDVSGQVRVEGVGNALHRNSRVRAEICHVDLRVNARVRPAAAGNVHLMAHNHGGGFLERLADRDIIFLHLPAVIGRTEVAERQGNVSHSVLPCDKL